MTLTDEHQDNWQQQVDEALALASIYGDDFRLLGAAGIDVQDGSIVQNDSFTVEDLTACPPPEEAWAIDCAIAVQIESPTSRLRLSLAAEQGSGLDGANVDVAEKAEQASCSRPSTGEGFFSVCYLPPINLRLRLHPAYPSSHPPQVLMLTALWLTPAQRASLRQQLQQLWDDQGPGLPICFTWVDWLKSSVLECLGASNALALGSSVVSNDSRSIEALEPAATGAAGSLENTRLDGRSRHSSMAAYGSGNLGAQEEDAFDEEQAEDSPDQVLFMLLRYDAAREHQEFQQSMHTCSICFEEQPGTSFERLECHHHYCQGCLGEQARIHVREGSLEQLKCPDLKCGVALSPKVLKRVLSPEEFARWEQLTLQRTLDRMVDAVYCPRCSTVSLEDEDNCAQCPKCFFVFCSLCNESWHPGTQCVSAETRLAMLQRKMAGGGAKSVQELRRKEQEMLSLATIEGMSKKCPRCSMAIQKSEGCNKMTCGNCGAFFCFKCGKEILGYGHFKSGDCILFDEEEILRWEQQWEDQMQRVAFGEARNDFFMQQQLALLGGGHGGETREVGGGRERLRGCHCPQCGQVNYKMGNNNHMNCWACTSHFCYLCRQVLRGKGSGGVHFGPKGCKQHSLD